MKITWLVLAASCVSHYFDFIVISRKVVTITFPVLSWSVK